ncbi:hypothetical protein LINGRAHAP2_LOCUS2597 [Linum grandiflorum]
MIILAWNYRGLGNRRAVQTLGELVKVYQPDVVFLSETLVSSQKMEEIRVSLKFKGCFSAAARGRSGGLSMLWKKKDRIRVIQYYENFIDTRVLDDDGRVSRLTRFYGCPERGCRTVSWELLTRLGREVREPWCVVGDFNDILHQYEPKGRNERPQPLIDTLLISSLKVTHSHEHVRRGNPMDSNHV